MAYYTMNLKGDLSLGDYENIYGYLEIVNCNDNFHIDIDKNSNINIEIILKMLLDNNFIILEDSKNNFGNHIIFASKEKII